MSEQHTSIRRKLPTRREALRAGVATGGTAILSKTLEQGVSAAEAADEQLVDAHVHVWTPDTESFPLAGGFTRRDMQPPSFTPAELIAHAKPAGVGRVVLIQMSFYGFDNAYMLRVMQAYPGVFSGVAVIDEGNQPVSEMKRLAKLGVRGFRIQPRGKKPNEWLSGDGMRAMWKCGSDEGLAMCHLINPEFLPSVERMCRAFRQTPVVIDHFARIGIDGSIRREDLDNLCRLARFERVSVKISAYYALGKKQPPYEDLGPMIQRLLNSFGAERLMWASDCPYQVQAHHTYQASIDLIKHRLAFLTASDREWILGKSAERVFFS